MQATGDVTFADLLKQHRERSGLSQQELADRAELTTHAVSALERGTRTRPYPHTVRSLADALELDDDQRAAFIASVRRRSSRATDAAAVRSSRLRVPATTVIGREADVAAVVERVRRDERLVTLTGPGGVGKTRLAVAVADELTADFAGEVVQVSLASLIDASAVVRTIGDALGVAGSDGPDAIEVIAAALGSKKTLLVIDNFEHVLSAAADVGQLSAACPRLSIVVTSRSVLRLRGEVEYGVAPLALPDRDVAGLDGLVASAAGALVADRLHALDLPDIGDEDAEALVELCHRLAGIPLAIELAVAHLRVLTPAILLDRWEEAAALSGARDLPERQRTMRATLDWSYGLLDERDQRLFTLLGVFRGGATIEAIEAVAADEFEVSSLLAGLGELTESSLVTIDVDSAGGRRVRMLEPIAQYARAILVGERFDRLMQLHAEYFVGLVERAASGYERADQVVWLERTEADEANVRVAIDRALDRGDSVTAARLTWCMWLYWWLRGQFRLGRRTAERCLEHELSLPELGRAHLAMATMAYAGNDPLVAAQHWAAALDAGVSLGDAELITKARAGLGLAAMAGGDLATAEQAFREAITEGVEAGPANDWLVTLAHVWLGTVRQLLDDPQEAITEIERGLAMARQRGDRLCTYISLYNLAQIALDQGDHVAANQRLVEGVVLSDETKDMANLAYFLELLAVVEWARGHHDAVPSLLGATAGLRDSVGASVYAYYQPDVTLPLRAAEEARQSLGDDAFDDAFDAGLAFELADVMATVGQPGRRD